MQALAEYTVTPVRVTRPDGSSLVASCDSKLTLKDLVREAFADILARGGH